jgi:anaerobic selenocysteine-containing dehydrogenase
MAKYLAAKASWEAANACLQFHGGFGFACEYDVERKFRETRLYQVAPISTNLILSTSPSTCSACRGRSERGLEARQQVAEMYDRQRGRTLDAQALLQPRPDAAMSLKALSTSVTMDRKRARQRWPTVVSSRRRVDRWNSGAFMMCSSWLIRLATTEGTVSIARAAAEKLPAFTTVMKVLMLSSVSIWKPSPRYLSRNA